MEHNLLSTKDADGYGILDAADKRGHKNAYIDYLQKLALDREGAFKFTDIVLNQSTGDSYTRHRRHVDTTRSHVPASVPMLCGLI